MKKYIHFIIASILMAHCAMAQDTTYTSEYFKLIKTYNTLDEVYLAHPELKPVPPKIVINDDEVLFYNDERAIVNRMPVVKEEAIPVDDPKFEEYGGKNILRFYRIINNEFLRVWETYGEWEGQTKAKNARLYDTQGNFVTNINKWHTDIEISNDNQKFLTYNYNNRDTLMIYNIDGKLISSSYLLESNSTANFSINTKSIKIKNMDYGNIKAITFSDEELFSYNYRDLVQGEIGAFLIFEEPQRILLSTIPTKQLYCFDFDKNIIWNQNVDFVKRCIQLNNKIILLYAHETIINPNNYLNFIYALDLVNGSILFKLICNEVLNFGKDFILIKKGNKYHEYKSI